MTVMVKDQGTPVRSSVTTASVRINVNRNINCPQFSIKTLFTWRTSFYEIKLIFKVPKGSERMPNIYVILWKWTYDIYYVEMSNKIALSKHVFFCIILKFLSAPGNFFSAIWDLGHTTKFFPYIYSFFKCCV
jgi:hypothetical protein